MIIKVIIQVLNDYKGDRKIVGISEGCETETKSHRGYKANELLLSYSIPT